MHTYMMFLRYADHAPRDSVHGFGHPAQEARATIEEAGGEMHLFQWGRGDHDESMVYSMPSTEVAAEFESATLASGRFATQRTYRLQDSEARGTETWDGSPEFVA